MVFFVNCACDLYGRKENLRFDFALRPTMSELISAAETQFDVCGRASRPTGYPDIPFRVQTFQVYDDILMRWVDLYSTSQLTDGCQVYCFQPDSIWNPDLQGTIPVAKGTPYSVYTGSPSRVRLPLDYGVTTTSSEKLRAVFADLDTGNKGYILYSDLRSAFLRNDIDFTYTSLGELFNRADANHDGSISYEEWVRFAVANPNLVDALFFRERDHVSVRRSYYYPTLTEELRAQRREREAELDRMYREAQYVRDRNKAERDLAEARREVEVARAKADLAAQREREARTRLHYTPTSPRYGYR